MIITATLSTVAYWEVGMNSSPISIKMGRYFVIGVYLVINYPWQVVKKRGYITFHLSILINSTNITIDKLSAYE